jgi:hypothetical protein
VGANFDCQSAGATSGGDNVQGCNRDKRIIWMAILLPVYLGGCGTASQPNVLTAVGGGMWSVKRETDRISGKESLSVTTISSRTEYSPPRDIGVATLGLICARGPEAGPIGYPTVMIMFSYPVGSQHTAKC